MAAGSNVVKATEAGFGSRGQSRRDVVVAADREVDAMKSLAERFQQRIAEYPVNQVAELLPWAVANQIISPSGASS